LLPARPSCCLDCVGPRRLCRRKPNIATLQHCDHALPNIVILPAEHCDPAAPNIVILPWLAALRLCLQATSLFTGSEELARLSNAQMNALLLYDDWPEKHEGPGDLDEMDGLGGLFEHVAKDHVEKQEVEQGEETEEHAERRHAVAPGGPRHDYPELLELDALVAELQDLDKKGELWWYPEWEADKNEAERVFVETPDELSAWLDRMRIKQLSESEKRIKVVELAERLVNDAIIAVPPQTWKVDLVDAQDTSKEATQEELLFFRLGFIFMAYRVDFWYWEAIEVCLYSWASM